jgi:hypothetical protein
VKKQNIIAKKWKMKGQAMVVLLFRKHYNKTNKQTTLMDGLKKRMENRD